MSERILVVDDEPIVLEVLARVLRIEGFQADEASDGASALEVLGREPFDLVLCDIRMPGMDGFELVREVRRAHPGTDIVMMTGFGSLDGAVEAMSLGAADYLLKPLKPTEVVARLRSILERRRLERQVQELQSELGGRYDLSRVVAVSPRMSAVHSALRSVARSDDPVLLRGEPGSGRKLFARAIHSSGPRREHDLRCVRCDLLPPAQCAAELFGPDEAGDGVSARGVLQSAHGGSVHLHAIDRLSPDLQRRLPEVLSRARDEHTPRLFVSIEDPLAELLESGELAPELALLRDFVSISIPPLRDRLEDLPGLVASWLEDRARETGTSLRCGPSAMERLAELEWPQNVRSLHALLHQCAGLALDGEISVGIIDCAANQPAPITPGDRSGGMSQQLDEREYQLVVSAVARNPGRLDQAARELGISRTTLWRRMRKYGIKGGPGQGGGRPPRPS